MSRSLNIATEEHLWEYYVKLPDFEAQCMFCEDKYTYINPASFQIHIGRDHREIWEYENQRKLTKWPWMYFKYSNNTNSQCIICDVNVPSTYICVDYHLSLHSTQQRENYKYGGWASKYWTKKDDFVVECNICRNNLSLFIQNNLDSHIKNTHLDQIEKAQKIHDTAGSSKRDSLIVATQKHLWKYYVKLSDFKAQCMFCENKYVYINTSYFQIHIATCHRKIWKYEKKRKLTKRPWMYFKYLNKLYSQCIICNATVLSKSISAKNHLTSHSKQERENYIYRHWSWKYCTKRDDFMVECKKCSKKVSLLISSYLHYHIKENHSDKLEDTQETYNTVDSQRVSSLQIDTTSRPLNVITKKCDMCNKEVSFSTASHLSYHMKKEHSDKLKSMQKTHDTVGSSKRVSSLKADTKYMSLSITQKKKQVQNPVWKYYFQLPNFEAQCLFCKNIFVYVNFKYCLKNHLVKDHTKIWKYEEERKFENWHWMYFKYLNKLYSQCIICNAKVLSLFKSVKTHLSSHSKQQRQNCTIYRYYARKYFTQCDDFKVKCDKCNKEVSLSTASHLSYHMKKEHSDKLKKDKLQKTHDTVGSSKRVSSLEADTTYMSLSTTQKKTQVQNSVWKYYVKLPDFKAQCMFCKIKYSYMSITTFQHHIKRKHIEIWTYEEERKLTKWPWRYFKYFDKLCSQCIICDANVLSTTESVRNHLRLHFGNLENNTYNNTCWAWKYCTKRDDYMVKCNKCSEEVSIVIQDYLYEHIKNKHSDKLKKTQETHDTVGSSQRVSSLQMDTMSRPLNVAPFVEHLWKYYTILPDFKAKCMFCENKYAYINLVILRRHIVNDHEKIWNYEREKKRTTEKWVWMYFKYSNDMDSQCIICDTKVLSLLESAKNHLSSHSEQQRQNCSVNQDYARKYFIQSDDFKVKCTECSKEESFSTTYLHDHIKRKHSDKLKKTRETHDTVGSSARVSSLEMDTTPRPLNVVTNEHVWEYYVKLPGFEAQCMFCENKYMYINVAKFKIHVLSSHEKIWKYEEERKITKRLWMYFKYSNDMNSQCIICDTKVLSSSESVKNHLSSHSEQQRKNYIYRHWSWKYWTKRGDFAVECNICRKRVCLSLTNLLNDHIKLKHSDKLEKTQETHDTVHHNAFHNFKWTQRLDH